MHKCLEVERMSESGVRVSLCVWRQMWTHVQEEGVDDSILMPVSFSV